MTADAIDVAAHTLVQARYAIALVGAGISVESGIPPFRGAGGLWTKRGEPPMDAYRRFMEDPAAGWRDMLARRETDDELSRALRDAKPNPAHHAMARLERLGVLRHTISQNVDDLHFQAGQVAVTEIHGNRTKVRCIDCEQRWPWAEFTISDIPPYCPDCRGIVKSDTVMFGEPIPRSFLAECQRQADMADCVLIAGTSATVYPAAAFPEIVLNRGGAIIDVNTAETPYWPHAAAILNGPAGQMLPALADRVEALLAERQKGAHNA